MERPSPKTSREGKETTAEVSSVSSLYKTGFAFKNTDYSKVSMDTRVGPISGQKERIELELVQSLEDTPTLDELVEWSFNLSKLSSSRLEDFGFWTRNLFKERFGNAQYEELISRTLDKAIPSHDFEPVHKLVETGVLDFYTPTQDGKKLIDRFLELPEARQACADESARLI
jgi:hypothetical protein